MTRTDEVKPPVMAVRAVLALLAVPVIAAAGLVGGWAWALWAYLGSLAVLVLVGYRRSL